MPKGPRKFYFTFEKSGLTRFGGLSLFQVFCRSLQIRRFLQVLVHWPDYDYRGYHPADLFLAHVFSIVAGLGRIENTQCLIHNGLVPPLLGLNDFPHRDTLRTFLLRFGPESLRNLQAGHDKLRSELFRRLGLLYSATVDADTTTLITYGSQEGVARGYIPKRRHTQPSYAPPLVQRRSERSQPGDGVAGRECAFLDRGRGVPRPGAAQAALVDGRRAHPAATGRGFLRPEDYRAPGKSRLRPCGRGADVSAFEAKDGGGTLSRVRSRLGGRRVYLHALSLEKGAPFRGRAPACGGGARRGSAPAVHLQALHLPPRPGDQPGADSSSGLALLLRSRFSGTPAARIQGCLRHEQDPHPEVFGQRRLSGGDSVGLRLGAGFSEALSPSRTAPLERLHPPPRALVASGGMGQTRQSQPSALAGEISAARPFRPSPAGHGQSATADLTDFAKVPTCVLPKIQEI